MARTAHPYLDTDVIDARAPRFLQGTVGTVSLIALLAGPWWLVTILAVQLIVGLTLGRRWCLPCVFYFEVVQPRLGEGEIEDARAPRFANILGAVFLSSASIAYATGLTGTGQFLTGMVAALALLAASTGLCVGCEVYRFAARARGVRPGGPVGHIDLTELGAAPSGDVVVQFSHPLCSECHTVHRKLESEGREVLLVDISKRRDLAHKYHVSIVPAAYEVAGDGRVVARLA